MKILVSGGAGYIGSAAVAHLIENGDSAIVIDNLYQGHRQAVHSQALFYEVDLADKQAIDAIMKEHRPDGVMHFAANTLVGESNERPFLYLRDNTVNGLNLIESAVEHNVGRFILSSTANLFDDPLTMPIDENERIVPGSPYGESKFFLERILYWMDRLHGMRYGFLRYFNACGATDVLGEDHDPETHIIPLILQVALGQRQKFTVFGNDYDTPDGTCIRDYVHIRDLAEAHRLTMLSLEQGSRKYNLGSGRGFSVMEVIETAREVTGLPISIEIGDRRPGDPDILIAGSESIKRELQWQPKITDLKEIIESAWRWHRLHPHGYSQHQKVDA